jgi:hypothetical protein
VVTKVHEQDAHATSEVSSTDSSAFVREASNNPFAAVQARWLGLERLSPPVPLPYFLARFRLTNRSQAGQSSLPGAFPSRFPSFFTVQRLLQFNC